MGTVKQEPALSAELPYWDFFDNPIGHAVLSDGSLVAGLSVQLRDTECFDEASVNHFTVGLRSALNALSEGVTVQFHLSVNSDFEDVIAKHVNGRPEDLHPLVRTIAEHREKSLKLAGEKNELYRPKLSVFLKVPLQGAKRSGLFQKAEEFSKRAENAYSETVEALSQNLEGLRSSFPSSP